MGLTPRSRSQGQKQWYPLKGLITRNTHVKYQSSRTHCSKVISKVKVSERRTEWQNYRITEWQNDRQDKNNMPPDLRSRGHKKRRKYIMGFWVSYVLKYQVNTSDKGGSWFSFLVVSYRRKKYNSSITLLQKWHHWTLHKSRFCYVSFVHCVLPP